MDLLTGSIGFRPGKKMDAAVTAFHEAPESRQGSN
jgi:hypothetical protein